MILPEPLLQLGFATLLDADRKKYLLDALRTTIGHLPLSDIDAQLAQYADAGVLAKLAGAGVRGETFFPVPIVLDSTPNLLGYYRLLYGFSQKAFYGRATGCTVFRRMEIMGQISIKARAALPDLCAAFGKVGAVLVNGLGSSLQRPSYSDELCLLTLGAQYRGSANNTRGNDGIKAVFATIKAIFESETISENLRSLTLRNASGRNVLIELAADPDIVIRTVMSDGSDRIVVAIEVKAGEDHSNIWNRVGEAEKSHLKAKERGVVECWTIINDPHAPPASLSTASPSTNRFYQLTELTNDKTAEHTEFTARLRDMVGL